VSAAEGGSVKSSHNRYMRRAVRIGRAFLKKPPFFRTMHRMSEKTRATLLARLRDGSDQLSWEEFFHRYWPLVYALARRRGCSEHTAEEVVQDVMLTLFDRRDVFQYDPAQGRFRDWLATVVRNKVAEIRRRPSERIRAVGQNADFPPAEPEARDTSPEDACQTAFENALLMVLLDAVRREMNPRAYLAFELTTLAELPGGRVARITGMTRNAVYKARRRVFQRLLEMGASYRSSRQLQHQLKEAMTLRPAAAVERAVTVGVEKTMASR